MTDQNTPTAGATSHTSVQYKEPEGFTLLDRKQFQQEATLADINDDGKPNVFRGTGRNKTSVTSQSYAVSEEERTNPFADNSSLQSVVYKQTYTGNPSASAFLTSDRDDIITSLEGRSDGTVNLRVHESQFKQVTIDITEVAAKAGITAAGIRRTQQDIAKDGEVDRPEQRTIIDMIDRAKVLAGVR